jgi:methylmalonyl-CoA/ethylmalonyl-CoA epimerase
MTLKPKGLDHVAIAVKDLDRAIEFYQETLGLELCEREEVAEQQVIIAMLGRGAGRIELICPTNDNTGVARFLEKRGEGLHHVCFEVEDLEAAIAELRRQGARLIDQEPRPGAGGARVAFVHPQSMRGVLTELRQGPRNRTLTPSEPLA